MSRLEAFLALQSHGWYSRIFKRLSTSDVQMAKAWIEAHDHLDKDAFEMAANRMFLDRQKPKKAMEIQELIATANVTKS